MKRIILIFVFVFVLAFGVASVARFAQNCAAVRADVLRLHVVADSDSPRAQQLKLKVRDALLQQGSEVFSGSVTAADAVRVITPHIAALEQTAERVLRRNGCGDTVKITVQKEFFNTRCYENFTMPAGVYTAVRVNIGAAQGHNWWCVMFPPLCLPAASRTEAEGYFTQDEQRVVTASPRYEPRFKIVEIIEQLKNRNNPK